MTAGTPTPDFTSTLQQLIAEHLNGRGLVNQIVTPEMSLKDDLHLASLDLIEIVLAFEELYPDCAKGEVNWSNIDSVGDLSNALWSLQFQTADVNSQDPLLQASIRRASARRGL